MDPSSPGYGFETRAIHAGQDPDPVTGSVVPAVHLATTYRQGAVGGEQKYEYARSGNPNRSSLEEQMASLEDAESRLCLRQRTSRRRCHPPGNGLAGRPRDPSPRCLWGDVPAARKCPQAGRYRLRPPPTSAIRSGSMLPGGRRRDWCGSRPRATPRLSIIDIAATAALSSTSEGPTWWSTTPSPLPICRTL